MKISTEIGSAAQLVGEEKAVEYVAKAGFGADMTGKKRSWCRQIIRWHPSII